MWPDYSIPVAANDIDDVPSMGMRVTKLQVVKDTPSYSACPRSDETRSFKIDVFSIVFVGDS